MRLLTAPRTLLAACAALIAACGATSATAPQETARKHAVVREAPPRPLAPRLVIAVVIDQLGSDTFAALEQLLPEDGLLRRAVREGRVFERAVYPYAVTLTGPGHAAIFSGAVPAQSGIAANYLRDPTRGDRVAVVDDGKSAVLGAPDQHASPAALKVDTVGDVLKRTTASRGKVVSLSLKDRSAILPAGKQPDLVLWYEPAIPGFTTSSYYASALPPWLADFEKAHPIDLTVSWTVEDGERLASVLGPDASPGEGDYQGITAIFPKVLSAAKSPAKAWPLFPQSSEHLATLAAHVVGQLGLCTDDAADLLALSISGTDYAGHAYGPESWEYADALRRADRALARMIEGLAKTCDLAVLVTSDHGVSPVPERHGGVRIDASGVSASIDAELDRSFGAADYIAGFDAPYLYLTAAARSHARSAEIRARVLELLRGSPGIVEAFDTTDVELLRKRNDLLASQVLASIHPESTGDVMVIPVPYGVADIGVARGKGTTHGSPHSYDTDVPVFVWGKGITAGREVERVDQRRVASTLAELLRVQAPMPDAPKALPLR